MVKILRKLHVVGVSVLSRPIRPLHGTATAPYHGDALLAEGYSEVEVKET